MRILRSPVVQFLIVGSLFVVGILIGSDYFAGRAASDEAVAEARRTTQTLATSVAEPELPPGLVKGNEAAVDRIDGAVKELVLVGNLEQVNIVTPDGQILYSTDSPLIGTATRLGDDQERVLADGGTGARVASSNKGRRLQTYALMQAPTGEPLLFEAYYVLDEIEDRQADIFASFRWISVGPVVLLMLIVTVILRFLTGQLVRAGKERERLLRSAIDASDAERRRIARDLHDGVVQDLAGTAFSVSAVARDPATPHGTRASLNSASTALRDSLKGLRSLLAEIHPPELHPDGLPAALADLIAPAAAGGIQASVSVAGAETASDAEVALVWRVAQEAVRNAIRHSGASTLAVTVRGDGHQLALEVVDDGSGFDPDQVRDPHRYGLRGLRSLVRDVGGELEVLSAPGEGTTVRMEMSVT